MGDTAITYDADGNLTSDGTTTQIWNDRDQMACLQRDGLTASFGYATDGRRLSRAVNGATTTLWVPKTHPGL